MRGSNVSVIWPNVELLMFCLTIEVAASVGRKKFVWLKTLKASARNSMLTRSLTGVRLMRPVNVPVAGAAHGRQAEAAGEARLWVRQERVAVRVRPDGGDERRVEEQRAARHGV